MCVCTLACEGWLSRVIKLGLYPSFPPFLLLSPLPPSLPAFPPAWPHKGVTQLDKTDPQGASVTLSPKSKIQCPD